MNGFDLDSDYQRFITEYLEVSGLSTASSVAQQRADYESVVAHFRYPRPAGVSSNDAIIQGRHGPVPLRHYHGGDSNPQTLIVFAHGGGFILGSLDSHDDICAELCAATGIDLVSIAYRLSPEHYHPTHLDDVEDAFIACRRAKSILVGVSAGATLCAALSYRLRTSADKATGQVLIYPSLGGDHFNLPSYQENAEAPLLTTADIHFYRGIRCENGIMPPQDPEFYPLLAQDFHGIPATIAISANVDPLRDDAALYTDNLKAAKIDARCINEAGLTHDFLRARHISARAAGAFRHICDAITELASDTRDRAD